MPAWRLQSNIAVGLALGLFALLISTADAQTRSPALRPADPFDTDWAKPQRPNPGGRIYDDPRLRQQRPFDPVRPSGPCPAGKMYDPVNQICR